MSDLETNQSLGVSTLSTKAEPYATCCLLCLLLLFFIIEGRPRFLSSKATAHSRKSSESLVFLFSFVLVTRVTEDDVFVSRVSFKERSR
jgi:hypothetical protein